MAEYEQYKIIDDDRIVPIHRRGWVKNSPEAQNFPAALQIILNSTGFKDAGLSDNDSEWHERVKNEISEIFSAHFIDPEEALFILTGIISSSASYLFEWEETVYFTMRPDFGLLCIMSNLNEMPINCYESGIRDQLLDEARVEIEAIYRAIKNSEILKDGNREAPFEQWIALFQKRGFDLSHIPQKFLADPFSRLIKENTILKTNLEQSEKKSHELFTKLQKSEQRVTLTNGDELSPQSERTHLNIIGALLEIVTGTFKDEIFSSETQLREFIAEKFDDLRGVSPRTLADKFALAKKALKGELD